MTFSTGSQLVTAHAQSMELRPALFIVLKWAQIAFPSGMGQVGQAGKMGNSGPLWDYECSIQTLLLAREGSKPIDD